MAYVPNIDAGKMSIFQGRDRSSPNALMVLYWWPGPAQYLKNRPLLSIYQNHKLHLRLTRQNIHDFSTPPHCGGPDGKHKPASKKNHLQSFRQDTQAQGSSGCKSSSPPEERELFHTGSSWLAATNTVQEKFPLLQVFFQCFRKFSHSTTVQSQGCSQGLSQQDKSFECAASCEHQSGCSRWTMGENTEQEAKDITM